MAPLNNIKVCVQSLEENSRDVYLEVTGLLLTLANNIIENPTNPKFRSVRLANPTIANKLVPAIGAMECLFEMGFEEADDSLVLSELSSLHSLKLTRDEILKRRKMVLSGGPANQSGATSSKSTVLSSQPTTSSGATPSGTTPSGTTSSGTTSSGTTSSEPAVLSSQSTVTSSPQAAKQPESTTMKYAPKVNHSLMDIIRKYSKSVLQYETESLQRDALACIPLAQLELRAEKRLRAAQKTIKKMESSEKIPDLTGEQMLLLELMDWFKNSFFKWVDTPTCSYCSKGTKSVRRDTTQEFMIDVFKCTSCNKETLFPRYNDARKLLKTRCGRCGEWANCFTLFCRSLRYEARLVVDITDHVWTEVFLPSYDRWVHCDPCENAFDQPLLYELGWGKRLSYVMAFSHEDIQDVSWRYSANHSQLLERRNEIKESALLDIILEIRQRLQQDLSPARKAYLQQRTLKELVELLKEPVADKNNYSGRQSGSLAWRLARGETSPDKFAGPYVWKPNKAEIEKQLVHITYSSASDCYMRPAGGNETLRGWQNGAFSVDSMFRKEEKDWKMVYLARTEGSEKGIIEWKLNLEETGLVLDTVTVALTKATYENGCVSAQLCGESSCLIFGGSELTTDALSGEKNFTLKVQVSGGRGDVAWQHAQILRSSCDSQDVTLDIKVKLKPQIVA